MKRIFALTVVLLIASCKVKEEGIVFRIDDLSRAYVNADNYLYFPLRVSPDKIKGTQCKYGNLSYIAQGSWLYSSDTLGRDSIVIFLTGNRRLTAEIWTIPHPPLLVELDYSRHLVRYVGISIEPLRGYIPGQSDPVAKLEYSPRKYSINIIRNGVSVFSENVGGKYCSYNAGNAIADLDVGDILVVAVEEAVYLYDKSIISLDTAYFTCAMSHNSKKIIFQY